MKTLRHRKLTNFLKVTLLLNDGTYIRMLPRATESIGGTNRVRFILRNWLMFLLRQVCLKSAGQVEGPRET